jgi:hypothetical protein
VHQQTRESFVDTRVRPWLLVSLGISLALVMLAMGVVAPVSGAAVQAELGARIVRDIQRLRAAVADYALDTGAVPPAVFDLSRGYDGGMTDVDTAPFRVRASWNGPYLPGSMARPTPASFWGLTGRRRQLDRDGDGQDDELWARLHRGHGEIDDSLAAWCDAVLDDGAPDAGAVRVTPDWVWFHLIER